MTYLGQTFASPQEALEHHGIKGQRWGVRRESGSHPSTEQIKSARATRKEAKAELKETQRVSKAEIATAKERMRIAKDNYKNMPEKQIARTMTNGEKVATGVVLAAAAAGVTYAMLRSSGSKTQPNYSNPKVAATIHEARRKAEIAKNERARAAILASHRGSYIAKRELGETVSVHWR